MVADEAEFLRTRPGEFNGHTVISIAWESWARPAAWREAGSRLLCRRLGDPNRSFNPLQFMKSDLFRLTGLATIALSSMLLANPTVPDLTQGEQPTVPRKMKKPISGNLGPTGLIGWVYHEGINTDLSRQILVTEVAQGSPSFGIVKEGDVILGASGKAETPADFTTDARRAFAAAIAEAEAASPAALYLKVWRQGKTATLSVELQTMGAYGPKAPYDCLKSRRVIKRALEYLEANESDCDRFGLNILAMLACDDEGFPGREERLNKAREWVVSMIPRKDHYEGMISDQVETFSKVAWNRTYHLIVMAEYYLATGDNPGKDGITLLMAIDAHAQTVARGQSMFGTMGHQFAKQGEDGSVHGPYAVGYGPINATGLAAFLGLTLARECRLPDAETNAQIEAGIERARSFFSYYVHRGSIPYGEHGPWLKSHCANGKNGLAALAFARVSGGEEAARYYSQLSVASGAERPGGHGGSYFNYLWTPIGANVGGEEAMAAYFRQVSWHLDLARTWDGGFYYNDYANLGYHGESFKKASLYMSTPALLTYAMGLRKLHLTGKALDTETRLSQEEVGESLLASGYQPSGRSVEELIEDLGSFSMVVRRKAAEALAANKGDVGLKSRLRQIAPEKGHPSRRGAVQALGLFEDADSSTLLIRLFEDEDSFVREEAIQAFRSAPMSVQSAQVDLLLKMAAARKRPPLRADREDPMNTTLIALTELLFDKKGILGKNLDAVREHSSMEQLFEAIRAVATLPSGGERRRISTVYPHLSRQEIRVLGDTLLELIEVEAPADAMFAEGVRLASAELLLEHRFAEAVEASLLLFENGGRWSRVELIRAWGDLGPSLKSHPSWPRVERVLKGYNDSKFKDEGRKALEAIENSKAKAVPFTSLH